MFSIYEKEFSITDNMCGLNQIIKPSGILDLMQSIAGEHANKLGIGYDDLIKINLAFVLLRVKYDMLKPIKRYTKVRVFTWPLKPNKIDFDRDFEIYDCDSNELLVKASSKWVLIDVDSRRICRSNMITYPTNIYPKNNYLEFDKLRFDDFKIDNDYEYIVRSCDLDLNNHMNNTKYSEIVNLDYNKIVKFCQIDYIHEVRYQDTLKVKTMFMENGLKVEGISNDNISFRMLFNYQ